MVVHRRNHRPPGNAWKYRVVSSVIAVSEFVAGLCRAAGIKPIEVVHDGADGWNRPERSPAAVPVYLVPAALVAHKGHAALIEAFYDVPGILELAGEGPQRARLEELARPLGDRVRFLGHVSDMAAAFARADVVVLPSLDEAAGSVLIEAMASGVPVVASAVGGIPELVGDAGILVSSRDRQAWIPALRRAPTWAVAPGRQRAASFSVAAMVAATEAAYRRALG